MAVPRERGNRGADRRKRLAGPKGQPLVKSHAASQVTICHLLAAALALGVLAGCQGNVERIKRLFSDPNLATAPIERLPRELPQAFFVEASAGDVYATLCHLMASDPECRIMAYAHHDHLLSWFEAKAPWADIERPITVTWFGAPSSDGAAARPEEGMALTTAWVEPLGDGCRLRLRRSYYSDAHFVGWAPSRGDYERELCRKLGFPFEPRPLFE